MDHLWMICDRNYPKHTSLTPAVYPQAAGVFFDRVLRVVSRVFPRTFHGMDARFSGVACACYRRHTGHARGWAKTFRHRNSIFPPQCRKIPLTVYVNITG